MAAAGQGMAVFADGGQLLDTHGIFILFEIAACAAFAAAAGVGKKMPWNREE